MSGLKNSLRWKMSCLSPQYVSGNVGLGFSGGSGVKNLPANAKDAGTMGATPQGPGPACVQPSPLRWHRRSREPSSQAGATSAPSWGLLAVLFQGTPSPPQTNRTLILWAWTARAECMCRVGSSHPFCGSSPESLSQTPPSQRQTAFSPIF